MIRTASVTAPLLLAALLSMPVFANGNIDAGASTIAATFEQEGVKVESPFTAFSGDIHYKPGNVTSSSATLAIETASFDLGDPLYNAEVRKAEWFDSDNYPTATFQSTAIEDTGESGFNATGELTIKAVTDTITVPVTVMTTGDQHVFEGRFTISRKAFGIGSAMWDDVLEDKVVVNFQLVTQAP